MIELLNVLGDDLMVANCARVSLDKWHGVFERDNDDRLIKYLARNNHWTPFAQPQVQFRITVPIFVARQWHRSNVGTVRNEVSRRYVDTPPSFYEFESFRKRPEGNIKQGSGGDLDAATMQGLRHMQDYIQDQALTVYREMLAIGVAPEQARAILPQTTLTSWVETGSLAYWARFCGLRLGEHAQKEIQFEAKHVSELMSDLFPVSWEELMRNA